MRAISLIGFIGSAIAVSALNPHALAQNRSPTAATPPGPTETTDRLLKQMGAYIGSAEQFTFRADVTFDHVLPSAQKLQFLATESVALRSIAAAQEKFGTFLRKPWRPSAKAWRVRAPPMPAGDKSACEQALADVQRAISP